MEGPDDSEIRHKDGNNSTHQRNPNNQYRGNNGPRLNRFQTNHWRKGTDFMDTESSKSKENNEKLIKIY